MGSYLGSKGPKNHQKSQKIDYFSNYLGIKAISPIHWIKLFFGTYTIECPKDKIIIYMVPGKNMGSYMGSKGPKNHKKITQKWHIFHIIWALKLYHRQNMGLSHIVGFRMMRGGRKYTPTKKCGMIVFEINAKLGQMGRTKWQFRHLRSLIRYWMNHIIRHTI